MTVRDSPQQRREHAWRMLGLVEDEPQIKAWLAEAGQSESERTSGQRGRRSGWLIGSLAAACALLAVGVSLATYRYLATQHYETRVGEQRDVLLSDGSRVTLNTNTALSVHYSRRRRYLLLERGEALFAVAHNAARPFDVEAAGTVTRALGTEFNIDMRGATVTVSVLEGVVQVSTPASAGGKGAGVGASAPQQAEAVSKGQALEFQPGERRFIQQRADLDRIDGWRTRRLEFSNVPLTEAVEEFNRYSSTPIVIGTPDLATVRISGIFRIGDTDGFLYSLRKALGVESQQSVDAVVLVRTDN